MSSCFIGWCRIVSGLCLSFRIKFSMLRTSMQGEVAYPHGNSPKQYSWSWAPWIYEKTDGYAGGVHAQIRKCALFRFQSSSAASLRKGSFTIRLLSVDESFIRVENWGAQQEYAYYWHHKRWERKHSPRGKGADEYIWPTFVPQAKAIIVAAATDMSRWALTLVSDIAGGRMWPVMAYEWRLS